MSMLAELFAPNKTVYTEWAIIAIIVVFSILATRNLKEVPGKIQNAGEMAVGKLFQFFADIMGEKTARTYFPYLGALFIFILVCNYSGEIPGAGEFFEVPTSVLAVPCALGVIAFVSIHTAGIKENGLKRYLKSFTKPVALLLPLTLLEQVVRPVSLALRLYGNLFGEEQVTEQLRGIFPLFLPWIMNVLSLLFCLIQAMIFTMLLAVFIGEALGEEEE